MTTLDISDRTGLVPSKYVKSTFFGYCQTRPPGRKQIVLLVALVAALVATIALTIYRLTELHPDDAKFTFGILILTNTVFCIMFVILGVFFHRIPELLVIIVAFVATAVILIIDVVVTTNHNGYFWARLVCFIVSFLVVVPTSCFIICHNYRQRAELPFYMGHGRKDQQNKILKENLFSSWLNLDLQISLTMVPLVWPEGIHFNEYDRLLIIPTAIASFGMFLGGHFVVWKQNVLVRRCRLAMYCIYSVCWCIILAYVVFLITETVKDLKENNSSTKAVDGIYYIAIIASVLSLLLKLATLVLGIIVSRNIEQGANTSLGTRTVNDENARILEERNQGYGGLGSSVC